MRYGSLFTGIGGFDLAAEWMGWEIIFNCENNEFCRKVLKYYWSKAISYGDIKTTDFTVHRKSIDILTGGFPCQPFSAAGKRKGTEDDRHLWPEMLRAIREVQPRWVVGENVLGLLNWSDGLVFHQVQTDLEAEGYIIFPYVLPACAKNAPHRRDRTWIVAYNNSVIWGERGDVELAKQPRYGESILPTTTERDATNTDSNIGCEGGLYQTGRKEAERHVGTRNAFSNERNTWDNFPTQSPLCSRDDGLLAELAGITVSKHRTESIKAYGNSVVPQVVFEIFKAIEQYECQNTQQ